MKITKRELHRIIAESLNEDRYAAGDVEDSAYDKLVQGIGGLFGTDKKGVSAKDLDRLTKGSRKSGAKNLGGQRGYGAEIYATHEKANSILSKAMGAAGMTGQAFTRFLNFIGVDELLETIVERSGLPLHLCAMVSFICMKKGIWEIDSDKHRKAMYWVCKNAERKGRKNIQYTDYYEAQKLAKAAGQLDGEIIMTRHGVRGAKTENPTTTNPYACLALTFGSAEFARAAGGKYLVADKYDFDQSRNGGLATKKQIEKWIPTVDNLKINVWDNFTSLLPYFYNKAIKAGIMDGKIEKDPDLASVIEKMLIQYETAFSYTGFRTECLTMSPQEAGDTKRKSSRKPKKKSVGGAPDPSEVVFPDDQWSSKNWESFVEDNTDEDKLQALGTSKEELKSDWGTAAKKLKLSPDMSGAREFIRKAAAGEFKAEEAESGGLTRTFKNYTDKYAGQLKDFFA